MTNRDRQLEILDRDELDAILAEIDEGRQRGARDLGPAFRRRAQTGTGPSATQMQELRDATAHGVEAWAKNLASRHQRRVESSLIGWDEVEVSEIAESLAETDQVMVFDVGPPASRGFVVFARPLAFALLCFEFGGRRVTKDVPRAREYSDIERRFLRRASQGLLSSLEPFWQGLRSIEASPRTLIDPGHLTELLPETVMLASADVTGMSDIGRARIGIPKTPFHMAEDGEPAPVSHHPTLSNSLAEVEIPVRVEIGSTRLSLAQLGMLEVGDELFLEPAAREGFLVRVGDIPKFVGTKGHVGGRLAVQVQNRFRQEDSE